MRQYNAEDVFNADEFGLMYCHPPTTTVGPSRVPGRKKVKDRITFLVCSNPTSTEWLPPLVVGRARRTSCLGGAEPSNYGFDYAWFSKAWMNFAIFCEWLYRFEFYVSQTVGRKVLLLIDNAPSHGNVDSLPPLRNIQVYFLLARTTSLLQPLDLGVIASLKK